MNFSKNNGLPYKQWIEEAQYGVIANALSYAAKHGLPKNHHFYITFLTSAPGVTIPDFLRAKYPEVMTIVLQHQFSELACMSIPQPSFTVTLVFSGQTSQLIIPFKAIVAFADPEAQLEFQFLSATDLENQGHQEETLPFHEPKTHEVKSATKEPKADIKSASIISLDRFRKKNSSTED